MPDEVFELPDGSLILAKVTYKVNGLVVPDMETAVEKHFAAMNQNRN